jgi:hypothetical protein
VLTEKEDLPSWAAQRAEDDTVHTFSPPNHKITTRWRGLGVSPGSSTMITVTGHVYIQYSLGVPYVFPIREHLVRFGQV